MLWWIAGGALVVVLVALFIARRFGRQTIVELPSPHPRQLGPDEAAAGTQARERALTLIRSARDRGEASWRGFHPDAYPYVEVFADRQRNDIHWVRFSTRLWFVPAGGEVIKSFDVGVTSRGLAGSSSFSLDVNEDQVDEVGPEDGARHFFWQETDEARKALDFVDQAVRRHGDFGVYGDLTAGIRTLARDGCTVGIRENRQGYCVHVDPIDGHGHFHCFQVDEDGTVGQPACGHYEPEPEEIPD